MPKEKNLAARAKELAALLNTYNEAYFLKDKPIVSDAEYDQLIKELTEIEESNPELRLADSPTLRVGAKPLDKFKKYKHRVPMLSLANAMNKDELVEFDERVKKNLGTNVADIEYFCELKFDGLSMSLVYEDGVLTHAATRGDGLEGEDVTPNIRTIKNVPLRLRTVSPPKFVEIRGEIILPIDAFQKLNRQREEDGDELFANPRNAAAGSVRQLDSTLTAERDLKFFGYAIGFIEPRPNLSKQADIGDLLLSWGFSSPPQKLVTKGADSVWGFYLEIEEKREVLDFDIDGVVVKVNSLTEQEELGAISRSPRSMVAVKFPPRQETTILEDILIQVGRTGVLSPVASLKPVIVHGVKVSRATLHNEEEIDRKDIRLGDHVLVQRAGDVIPEVVRPILEKRTGKEKKFIFPKSCPSCGSEVKREPGEVAIRCFNEECPAQVLGALEHFVSKRAMDIVGLGPKILEDFFQRGLVRKFSDLYSLKSEQILGLEGFREKSVSNLLESINASRSKELSTFIMALGIRHVGEQTAKALAKKFRSLDRFMEANESELESTDDVGVTISKSIIQHLAKPKFRKEIERLIELGLNPKYLAGEALGDTFTGMTFVITGTLPQYDRKDIEKMIEANGGKVSSSVSKKTSYIIVGSDAGSKLQKAQELGVSILSEEAFLSMVNSK